MAFLFLATTDHRPHPRRRSILLHPTPGYPGDCALKLPVQLSVRSQYVSSPLPSEAALDADITPSFIRRMLRRGARIRPLYERTAIEVNLLLRF